MSNTSLQYTARGWGGRDLNGGGRGGLPGPPPLPGNLAALAQRDQGAPSWDDENSSPFLPSLTHRL